jgi:hypothetical protein
MSTTHLGEGVVRQKVDTELEVVMRARDKSRAEAARLEELKEEARQHFLKNPGATDKDFELMWPHMRNEIFSRPIHELSSMH